MTDREKRRYESSAKAAFYSFVGLGVITMIMIFLDSCK
jgi:hypothetical protein